MSGLSPNVLIVEVGVRTVREETLYPLSMADQIALPDQLISAITKMGKLDAADIAKSAARGITGKSEIDDDKDMATVKIVMDLIVKNIDYILEKSMDNVTMADLTNDQFIDIVDKIFTINYESSMGKAMDLVARVKRIFRPVEKEAPGPILQE